MPKLDRYYEKSTSASKPEQWPTQSNKSTESDLEPVQVSEPKQTREMTGKELFEVISNCNTKKSNLSSDDIVKIISSGKVPVDYVDCTRGTALMVACASELNNIALALINTGKSRPDYVSGNDYTALMFACRPNTQKVALALIATGLSKPEHIAFDGFTALMYACANRLTDVALYLTQTKKSLPGHVGKWGACALFYAVKNGLVEVVDELITDNTVNLVFNGDITGNTTALIMACEKGMKDIALKLIESGRSKPHYINYIGETALSIAINRNMDGVIAKLRDVSTKMCGDSFKYKPQFKFLLTASKLPHIPFDKDPHFTNAQLQ